MGPGVASGSGEGWCRVCTRDRAGVGFGIGAWGLGQHRAMVWVIQRQAFSYHWALRSLGAVFTGVARRASGPRWSRGPWRPNSSILPLIPLKEMGFGVTLRGRGRGSSLQREDATEGKILYKKPN